jgi:cytochrome c
MDSFEWNKILGGVLGTALFIQAIYVGSITFFAPKEEEKTAYNPPGVQEASASAPAPAPAAEALPDFAKMIPAADVNAGAMVAQQCAVCHDWTKGGPNKIGPNLYGLIDRPKASHPGYDYSPAMKAKGGNWTYADLFQFIKQPQVFVPGTKMPFAGLPKESDRINVIAFLRMQADMPAPLPAGGGGGEAAPAPAP